MKRTVAVALGMMVLAGAAYAQPSAGSDPATPASRYIAVMGQATFGQTTSGAVSGEFGVFLTPALALFVEGGGLWDATGTPTITAAQQVAAYLATAQTAAVGYSVKQPVGFVVGGVRYVLPVKSRLRPFVMAGGGGARVTEDVHFTLGGSDVTSALQPYGVALGSDLAGSVTKGMITVGIGADWAIGRRLLVDVSYRYGRIFTTDGINVNRVGAGVGVRF